MSKDPLHDVDILKHELIGLFEHIQRIRKEIAAIRRPGAADDEDHFAQMSDELDAIVAATEGATNTIMENVEEMEDLINEVRPHVGDAEALALLDRFPDKTGAIFEACAFQDITGQRITKVVTSLQFIEARVNALISMWGPEALTKVAPNAARKDDDEYKKYLHGPQLEGQGVSQADVDALFGDPAPAPAKQTPPDKAAAKAKTPGPAAAPPAPAKKPASPAPAAAKPAAAKPPPPPAPPAKTGDGEGDDGPALGQDDIDKLFG
jgi:chemotaxis regulatin CheY-phosphate phosphatase CheZ